MPAELQPPTDLEPFASVGRNWREFVVVGAILVACGVAAIFAPAVANFATSTLLGTLLIIAGGACLYQAMRTRDWAGYNWQLLLGAGEMVGGIFIVINPLKGAAAVTLLVAIVVMALGVPQIGMALKIRPQSGWAWLAGAGLVSLLLGVALIARFPFNLPKILVSWRGSRSSVAALRMPSSASASTWRDRPIRDHDAASLAEVAVQAARFGEPVSCAFQS